MIFFSKWFSVENYELLLCWRDPGISQQQQFSHWRKKCGLRCHDVRESERASRRAGRQRSSWGHSHDPRPLGYVITKETPCRQFSVLVITKLIVGKRVRKFSLLHIHMLWKDSMTCKKSHPPSFILFYACLLCTRLFLNSRLRSLGNQGWLW